MEAVKKALNQYLPATITIPHEKGFEDLGNPCKKSLPVWITARDFLKNVIKWSAKYREGDSRNLNLYGIRKSELDPFYDTIIKELQSGWSKSQTVKEIYIEGYDGSLSNAFDHFVKIEEKEKHNFAEQPYKRTMTETLKYKTGSTGKEKDYITREGVFRHLWMNTALTEEHREYFYGKYPEVMRIHACIRDSRMVFERKNVPVLHLFIEKYQRVQIKVLNSFAKELE